MIHLHSLLNVSSEPFKASNGVKSRTTYSLLAFVIWVGLVLCRSGIYSSSHNFEKPVYLLADIAAIVSGVFLGFDMLASPETSIMYRLNRRWYSPGLIQVAGGFFVMINLAFACFVVYNMLHA